MKQVRVLFVDDTNLWSGLESDDNAISILAKGREDVNRWMGSLHSSGDNLNATKCLETLSTHRPGQLENWVYTNSQDSTQTDKDNDVEELGKMPIISIP